MHLSFFQFVIISCRVLNESPQDFNWFFMDSGNGINCKLQKSFPHAVNFSIVFWQTGNNLEMLAVSHAPMKTCLT